MKKAIFFDLYETLVTLFDPGWIPPSQTIAQRLGLNDESFGSLWRRFDQAWQAGEISSYTDALAQTCAAGGHQPDSALLNQLSDEYQSMTARVFDSIEAEIVELVTTLKRGGFKLGVITNAGDLDSAPWFDCRLAPFFDDFVASHQVRLLKRDSTIFELACQRLNVAPGEALFVGDGGGNELQGATKAGMEACCCTWFLDRWPEGIRPNGFPGDEWRQFRTAGAAPFEHLSRPADLRRKLGC